MAEYTALRSFGPRRKPEPSIRARKMPSYSNDKQMVRRSHCGRQRGRLEANRMEQEEEQLRVRARILEEEADAEENLHIAEAEELLTSDARSESEPGEGPKRARGILRQAETEAALLLRAEIELQSLRKQQLDEEAAVAQIRRACVAGLSAKCWKLKQVEAESQQRVHRAMSEREAAIAMAKRLREDSRTESERLRQEAEAEAATIAKLPRTRLSRWHSRPKLKQHEPKNGGNSSNLRGCSASQPRKNRCGFLQGTATGRSSDQKAQDGQKEGSRTTSRLDGGCAAARSGRGRDYGEADSAATHTASRADPRAPEWKGSDAGLTRRQKIFAGRLRLISMTRTVAYPWRMILVTPTSPSTRKQPCCRGHHHVSSRRSRGAAASWGAPSKLRIPFRWFLHSTRSTPAGWCRRSGGVSCRSFACHASDPREPFPALRALKEPASVRRPGEIPRPRTDSRTPPRRRTPRWCAARVIGKGTKGVRPNPGKHPSS